MVGHFSATRPVEFVIDEGAKSSLDSTMLKPIHDNETTGVLSLFPIGRLALMIMSSGSDTVEQDRQKRFDTYVMPETEVLFRVAMSITRNRVDAEDLVQDTMLRAYRAVDRFDGRHPRAWLLTIMRNAQINRVRRKRPELLRDPDTAMERLADSDADTLSVEDAVVDRVFDADVERALAGLSDKFIDVIEMVDLNGLSYQEAATALDVPVGTVMSRLHRARAKVRKSLEFTDIGRSRS
ncbi:MAG: sigma-70 family RNA polymerase sigma factor [Acidimicrobiales bacterium]